MSFSEHIVLCSQELGTRDKMTKETKKVGRPKKEVYYRLASIADLPRIIDFVKRVPKDNGIDDWAPTNPEYALQSLLHGLQGDRGFIFIATIKKSPYTKKSEESQDTSASGTASDTIVGVLIMAKGDLWWSTKEFYTNVVFYVEPLYRKRGVSENLLFLSKTFSADLGIPLIIEIMTEHKLPLYDRYFAMRGFKKVGAKYASIPKKPA